MYMALVGRARGDAAAGAPYIALPVHDVERRVDWERASSQTGVLEAATVALRAYESKAQDFMGSGCRARGRSSGRGGGHGLQPVEARIRDPPRLVTTDERSSVPPSRPNGTEAPTLVRTLHFQASNGQTFGRIMHPRRWL